METMSQFIHKDETITIGDFSFNEKVLKEFDSTYSKPKNWTRIYFQNRKHCLTNGTNQMGDEFPWKKGDLYIKSINELKLLEKQIELDEETGVMRG